MIDLRFHKPLISCFVYGNAVLQAAISKIPHQMQDKYCHVAKESRPKSTFGGRR